LTAQLKSKPTKRMLHFRLMA